MFGFSIPLGHLKNIYRFCSPNPVRIVALLFSNAKLLQHLHYPACHSMISSDVRSGISTAKGAFYVNSSKKKSTYMIKNLGQEGRIGEARQLFDKMSDPDVVACTSMISCYIRHGMLKEARKLFDRPVFKKNVITWTAMVGGYIKANNIAEAEKLFNEMPDKNVVSWNTMIDGYVQNAQIDMALHLFKKMPERNVVSWNTLINSLAQCRRIEEACGLFECMPERDVISWTAIVAGLSKNGRVDEARELFDRMPERNAVSWCSMITGYAQNSRLAEAFELFQIMPERDISSWNSMMAGFIQNGDFKGARELFDVIPEKNVISWTTMITGYVQDGQNEEALKTFCELQAVDNIKPNKVTFLAVLGACSNSAGLCEGQQIHQMILKMAYQGNPFVVSALIGMYSKCGVLDMAKRMFFDDVLTSHKDLVSWNGMITAYAHHGLGREAIDLFNEMGKFGFKADDVTYVGLLSACSHAGLVDEGLNFFDRLWKDKDIKIREDHYVCLVDLCGRAGRLKEAFELVERLGTTASASVLSALLAACNVCGNAHIGKLVARRLMEVQPENGSTYMLLSSIYASMGKWREAKKLRGKMMAKGLKKQPGCSWIEAGNKFHVFLVGDESQCECRPIYYLLHDLHAKMKKDGYGCTPSSDFIIEKDISLYDDSN